MGAIRRKTKIGNELENFLDENERNLSADMWHELEQVAATVDDMAGFLQDDIDDLKTRITGLEEQIEQLEAAE